jgi:hypothetical protein
MHSRVVPALVFALSLVAAPVWAQDPEQLRRELEQVKKQFETMKDGYQKAIDSLQKRIESLESRPAPAVPAPAVTTGDPRVGQAPPSAPPAAPPAREGPSLMELARPREPFELYRQRGPGQFLFDIGVVSDFVGDFTSSRVESTDTCTFPGGCNRFFPRAVEIGFYGQIDPYARGVVILEAGEEFSGGERSFTFELSEAYLTLLTLPFGTQAKGGKMLVRYGLLNEFHEHDFPQTDKPDVLTQFFGEEGLNESGLELSWVAPLPFYLQLLAGIFNGQNEVAFGSDSFRFPLVTARARTFFDLGPFGGLQLGGSLATGYTAEDLRSWVWGVDLKYKLTPDGWQWPLLTVAGEALFTDRNVLVAAVDPVIDPDTGEVLDPGSPAGQRVLKRHGFYAYAQVQPWKRWLGGVRFDWTQYPVAEGRQWGIEPYIAFAPSDFLRFRLGYKYTDRGSVRVALNPDGYPRYANEVFLQATFFLGAHPAHPF